MLGVYIVQLTAVCDKTGMCGCRMQDEDEQEVGNSGVSTVCPCVVSLIIGVCVAANRRRENTLCKSVLVSYSLAFC